MFDWDHHVPVASDNYWYICALFAEFLYHLDVNWKEAMYIRWRWAYFWLYYCTWNICVFDDHNFSFVVLSTFAFCGSYWHRFGTVIIVWRSTNHIEYDGFGSRSSFEILSNQDYELRGNIQECDDHYCRPRFRIKIIIW